MTGIGESIRGVAVGTGAGRLDLENYKGVFFNSGVKQVLFKGLVSK